MRLRPIDDLLVVKFLPDEDTTAGGLLIPEAHRQHSRFGEVLAVGPGRRLEGNERKPVEVSVGDRVALYQDDGCEVELDGEKVRIIRETNLLGVVVA